MNILKTKIVLFRVEGNSHIGMGHIFMCISLAELFLDNYGYESVFLMTEYSIENVCNVLKDKNISCLKISGENKYREDFNITKGIINKIKPEFIVFDLLMMGRNDEDLEKDDKVELLNVRDYIDKIKSLGQLTVAVSYELEYSNLKPHILIAPLPFQSEIEYKNDGVVRLLGLNYFLLGKSFRGCAGKKKPIEKKAVKILFAFGGSDHENIGIFVARSLKNNNSFEKTAIIGPGVQQALKRKEEFNDFGVEGKISVESLREEFLNADIALTNGGNMLFELIACQTPTLVISAREGQREFSRYMEKLGVCVYLGMKNDIGSKELERYIVSFSLDFKRRNKLFNNSKKLIDGRSGERIIEEINKCFNLI
jgi:spore coat polysaccharide biosynthesis predicted glycosyltransferase SpsG